VICRLYINGDGFPWDFGLTLAEHLITNQDEGPEWESRIALVVGEFILDAPLRALLIADTLGWGEDYTYEVHCPDDEVQITIRYPSLDHTNKEVTVTLQGMIMLMQEMEGRWAEFSKESTFLDGFEEIFKPKTIRI